MELCFGCYGQTCGEEPFTDLVCVVHLGQPGSREAGSLWGHREPRAWQFSKGRGHSVPVVLGVAPHSWWTVALQQISTARAMGGKIRRAKLKAVCESRAGKRGVKVWFMGKWSLGNYCFNREFSEDDAGQGEVRSSSPRKMRLLMTYHISFKAFFIHLLCVPCVEGQRTVCGSWFWGIQLFLLSRLASPWPGVCMSEHGIVITAYGLQLVGNLYWQHRCSFVRPHFILVYRANAWTLVSSSYRRN